jgi:hypothetical protein
MEISFGTIDERLTIQGKLKIFYAFWIHHFVVPDKDTF